MSSTNDYLKTYYRTKEQLAAACAISLEDIDSLIGEGLVPEPSYVVTDDGLLLSQAFGELPAHDAEPGQYFHRGNAAWVSLAIETRKTMGAAQAQQEIRTKFVSNFRAALTDLDKTVFRLADSFTTTGEVIEDGLKSRTDAAWNYFLKGIFSLCVADPSSEKSIARKEILQEALTKLSENGAKSDFFGEEKQLVLDLMAQYSLASMPFTPQEYPRSSRKRLVEDLAAKLGGLPQPGQSGIE